MSGLVRPSRIRATPGIVNGNGKHYPFVIEEEFVTFLLCFSVACAEIRAKKKKTSMKNVLFSFRICFRRERKIVEKNRI